jgi:DNA polymerase-3 subunit epsilon
VRSDSRPEYYDFDLFAAGDSRTRWTTGACPSWPTPCSTPRPPAWTRSGGDEIIQIGATRIVNGKLLRQESFEQLVDPRRDIPEGIPIHGITPEMVAGQPTIDRCCRPSTPSRRTRAGGAQRGLRHALPAAQGGRHRSALRPAGARHAAAVGGGAPAAGVPPLEAIAERFGVTVIGRHTALGDAMVTAEVFQKLIPLLADKGIHTLARRARRAAD